MTSSTWGGLSFSTNLGADGIIEYSDFSYAYYAAITVQCCRGAKEPANISNSTFRYNYVALDGYAVNNVIVRDSLFEENTYAVLSADKIIYDSIFKNNQYGLFQTERISVYDSVFNGNDVALYGGRGVLAYCSIQDNNIGVKAFYQGFTLKNNRITHNDIGVILGSDDGHTPPITYNNIFENFTYNVKTTTVHNIDAQNNWWGTIDPIEIEAKIYDGKDNVSLGLLEYTPFLLEPACDSNDDSDGDGVLDCLDICPGYDDNLDADKDNIPNCIDNGDTDGDGFSDADETRCGSDPEDSTSKCGKGLGWLLLLIKD